MAIRPVIAFTTFARSGVAKTDFRRRVKKIPNIKHQISNKSQISKFNDQNVSIRGLSYCLFNPVPPGMKLLGKAAAGSLVWDFEFGTLGFIWNLRFEIWNL
jgi:hypothetical protein